MIMLVEMKQLNFHDATKPPVASGVIRKIRYTGGTAVAVAVTMVAEKGPAFRHVAVSMGRPDRVDAWPAAMKVGAPKVMAPLPDVAYHVAKAEFIGRECMNRSRCKITVFQSVFSREVSLPHVATVPTVRRKQIVAPRKDGLFSPTSRGVFPLCFGWQAFPDPLGVRQSIVP